MAKKILQRIRSNLDVTGDVLSIIVAAYFLFRSQIVEAEKRIPELLLGILGVLTTLAISGIIEKKSRLTRIEKLSQSNNDLLDKKVIEQIKNIENLSKSSNDLLDKKVINRIRADEFFQKWQKPEQDFFASATTIYISGITLGSTIGEFNYVLGERLKGGAKIKIILLAADSNVLDQIVLRSWGEPKIDHYRKRLVLQRKVAQDKTG